MGPGPSDDARETSDLDAATVQIPNDSPPPTPFIGTYLYDDEDEDPRAAAAQVRGPRMWLPLAIFVVLLLGGVLVGRYVVPQGSPPAAAPTQASGAVQPTGTSTPTNLTALPPGLPTGPARPADALHDWATRAATVVDIPVVALEAYGYAQLVFAQSDKSCKLGWTTLAGIAAVESNHGRAGGAALEANGRSAPPILGPALDGKNGRPRVQDTDAGAFDGDATFDRTMGPMRLLPSQWRAYAVDADGDVIQDPYDIDDASLAMAAMLCSGTDDLSQAAGWNTAVARFHTGAPYANSVFEAANRYGQQTRSIG